MQTTPLSSSKALNSKRPFSLVSASSALLSLSLLPPSVRFTFFFPPYLVRCSDVFPHGFLACGACVTITKKYRPANLIGWIFAIIGFATLSLLHVASPVSAQIGYQVLTGIGLGILFMSPMYAVVAPLPITKSANALALFQFMRSLAQTVGITVGSAILQNELKAKLPVEFLDQFGVEVAYALIPFAKKLEEPMQSAVRVAYAEGTRSVWLVMVGLSVLGFFCVFATKELKMPEVTDEVWGFDEDDKVKELDEESVWDLEKD